MNNVESACQETANLDESSDDLDAVQRYLESGRALDYAIARGDISEAQICRVLEKAVDSRKTI